MMQCRNGPCRVVVLIGGNGSNLQAIIDRQSIKSCYRVVGVISHRADAYGLTRAKNAEIPVSIVPHQDYADRSAFESALLNAIAAYEPDLIVLAGFMRILSPEFVQHYPHTILNIHPSLLPHYKGLNTHQRVLEANEPEHGASVHFVTPTLDDGPVIAQIKIPVLEKEEVSSLTNRIHEIEHILYPTVIEWFAESRLEYKGEGVKLDNQLLGSKGFELTLTNVKDY